MSGVLKYYPFKDVQLQGVDQAERQNKNTSLNNLSNFNDNSKFVGSKATGFYPLTLFNCFIQLYMTAVQ